STARSASGVLEIPRIVRATVEEVVRLPRHQNFWCVSSSKNNRSCFAQALDQARILLGYKSSTQARARFTAHARHFDRTLDADRDSMQRTKSAALHQRRFSRASLAKHAIGIHLDKSIQLRIQPGNLREVRFRKLNWRDLLLANLRRH